MATLHHLVEGDDFIPDDVIAKLEGVDLVKAVCRARGWQQYKQLAHEVGSRQYPFFCVDERRGLVYVDKGEELSDNDFNFSDYFYNPAKDLNQAWELLSLSSRIDVAITISEGRDCTISLIPRSVMSGKPEEIATLICRAFVRAKQRR